VARLDPGEGMDQVRGLATACGRIACLIITEHLDHEQVLAEGLAAVGEELIIVEALAILAPLSNFCR
jgi:hypothetical protein